MFTTSLVDLGVLSVGVVLAVLNVLLQVQMAGPSGVDVINMLIEAVGVSGVSMLSTNNERQSADLFRAPDIHLNVILYVASSSDHLFTLLLALLPFRNFCRALWSL